MARRLSRLTATIALVLTGALLAACGVPTESEPNHINRNDVPFDLLGKPASAATTTTTTTGPRVGVPATTDAHVG